MGCLSKCLHKRVYSDREKAYFNAVERLDEETNIVYIVRDIRRMKLAFKTLLEPKQVKDINAASTRH